MKPEENICVCHRVSLRKLQNYITREDPEVASQLSECLGAGTSCGWCIPFLKKVHTCHKNSEPMDLGVAFENYASRRKAFNAQKSKKKTDD
jgi:bacterioferritin-associated ferredoxin